METATPNYLTTPVMTFTVIAIIVNISILVLLIGQIHKFIEN